MALKESEAIVLRTYPMREADLLVTLFTRLEGKVRGVARSAKKSKRRFGGALEPLTYVRVYYDDDLQAVQAEPSRLLQQFPPSNSPSAR